MNSAQRIVSKFGGQTALASLLGKRQSTIQHWVKTGHIPAKWQQPLLSLAKDNGIDLNPSDFVLPPAAPPPQEPRLPIALWPGELPIGEASLPVYVLDDGRRVISRSGAVALLTDRVGGGNLEAYLRAGALKPYWPEDIVDHFIDFSIPEVVNRTVRGLLAETFLDITRAFVQARNDGALTTDRQHDIAIKADMFLVACAKTGLIALIDEVTGYQYERAEEALRLKLNLFLEQEMRKWEKTFPDELWREFGRLTNWQGRLHERPKHWGKLVLELVYGYLDREVLDWLRENAPAPRKGQNYHQWLSSQYGLKRLTEHLWMLIGIAKTCHNMPQLREHMAVHFVMEPVQLTFYLPSRTPNESLDKMTVSANRNLNKT
jgi:P63C domain